jgi:LPXTG-site transpeptidase (sortase) family protein
MRGFAHPGRVQYAFWFAGALLCSLCAGAYLERCFYQAAENRRLEEALRSNGARTVTVPVPRQETRRAAGSLVGRLEIPRLQLSAIVLEGSDSRTLSRGVGRIPETANPGQNGNVVLSGHRDTFFRPLRQIRAGDRVTLQTPFGLYRYVVEWTAVVNPSDTASLKATPDRSLTLVTCYPFRYVGPAPQRFIVRARQVVHV